MDDILDNAFDSENFRRLGHGLVDLLAGYLERCRNREEMPVLPWREPEELKRSWAKELTLGTGVDPLDLWKRIMEQSIHLHHPRYIGHQVVPPVPAAILTDFLSDFLNNSMAVYEVGPLSTVIETIVVEWLAVVMGMNTGGSEHADGIFTSGGSIGNLTGLLAARQVNGGDPWETGVEKGKLAVMVPEESHYSVARAVKVMGMGEAGVVRIPVDERFRVRIDQLEPILIRQKRAGKKVIALVGNACSTSTGAYDPLEEMAAFCRQHSIWFHVDGAHGAGAALCDTYRHLVRGIRQADSLVIDFHKMFMCPSLATAVLFKQSESSYQTFAQKAEYLLEEKEGKRFDLATRTLECTKKMMAVKVFVLLRLYGERIFSDFITRTYDRAREFAELIQDTPRFELLVKPQANIVCFRHMPPSVPEQRIDEYTARLRKRLTRSGRFYIVSTKSRERLWLRASLMNPFTGMDDLRDLLKEIEFLGSRVDQ